MEDLSKYIDAIKSYIFNSYKNNFKEPCKKFSYPYLVPGANYTNQLWDWDSWLTGFALLSIDDNDIEKYEKGCILNFLDNIDEQGRIPILVQDTPNFLFDINEKYKSNIHKPCLAIHALEISNHYNDFSWLKDKYQLIKKFINYYENNQKHIETGLYFWIDDLAIGFDNDPTVFYQEDKSVAAIFLNSLMYKELLAFSVIADKLGFKEDSLEYFKKAESLKTAIQNECFDNPDGFFYSVSLNLKPINKNQWLHSNQPRFWSSLPIKISTWAGMLPLWANIASKSQADRCVKHYLNKEGLFSDFGIRSVAKNEKMFGNFDTGNPSCWLGPIWVNANYFTYVGLKNYGYYDLARDIAAKTIKMLGNDLINNHDFHEYYHSETGEGIRGIGFQSWNFLVIKMIEDLKNE